MLDFIVENIWILIAAGAVIILTAIGFIVDKFVINKNNQKGNNTSANDEVTEEVTEEVPEEVNVENPDTQEEIVADNNEEVVVANNEEVVATDENQVSTEENVNQPGSFVSDEEKSDSKESPWKV